MQIVKENCQKTANIPRNARFSLQHAMNQPPRSKWDTLSRRSVASALRAWRDLPKLGEHPLARLDIVAYDHRLAGYRDGTNGYGLALRHVLRETIELLRPGRGQPDYDDRRWFPYLILLEQDVNGRSRTALMGLLGPAGLPERTYDHYRAEAIDTLTNLLREKELEASRQPIEAAAPSRAAHVDWGDAPEVRAFHGRHAEMAEIEQWIVGGDCRVIGVVGMGGIGKTALAAQITQRVADRFERAIWRSLRNAPPLEEILADYLHFLAGHEDELPLTLDDQIEVLLKVLNQQPCLLILDNLETILREHTPASEYRVGYAAYGDFLRRLAQASHRSCLLVTSRETPPEFDRQSNVSAQARSYPLIGLALDDARRLLEDKQLSGDEVTWRQLIDTYSGNPLALKMVAETIHELFGGQIAPFLAEGAPIFGGVRQLLDEQFERLSPLECDVLYWLTIEREPTASDRLRQNLITPVTRRDLLEALDSLRRRWLIEYAGEGFTLPNLVIEHVTDRFVDQISREIITESIAFLNSHAVLQAQTKDYVRLMQLRLIVQPILEQALAHLHSAEGLKERLLGIVSSRRTLATRMSSYTAGNTLNLLHHAGVSLRGCDFSRLTIREAYLVEAALPEVDFAQSDLSSSTFAEVLDGVSAVAISHNGQLIVSGTYSNEIHVWRLVDGQRVLTLRGHTNIVRSLDFSPDDQLLASASSDQTIRLWDIPTGECLLIITGHTHRVRCVRFSADGQRLFSSSADETVREWGVTTGQLLHTLYGHTAGVHSLALSPDEQTLISAGVDCAILVWDLATNSPRATLRGHTAAIRSIAFSPDGRLFATASEDRTVRVWDAHSLACLQVLTAHRKWVYAVAFSSDGARLASAGEEGLIWIWDAAGGQAQRVLRGHATSIESLVFSPDGRMLASGSSDRSVQLWNPLTGQRLRKLGGSGNIQWWLAFSRDSRWLFSGGNDFLAHHWEVETGRHLSAYRGHKNWVQAVTLNPEANLLGTCSQDLTIKLWDVSSGRCLSTLFGHTAWPTALAFSPDGRYLASGSEDATARVWDSQSGHCLRVLTDFVGSVRWVIFNASGDRFAACGDDAQVIIWDTATWQPVLTLRDHTDTVWAVAFSADGSLIATGDEGGVIKLWEAHTGQCLRTLPKILGKAWTLDLHPSGDFLVVGGADEHLRVWDVRTGQVAMWLRGHAAQIRYVCYSPDGHLIATSSDDQTIRLWDSRSGECLRALRVEPPYERMNITGAIGLSGAQRASLKALGAIEV